MNALRILALIAGGLIGVASLGLVWIAFGWYHIYALQNSTYSLILDIFLLVCTAAILLLWLFRPSAVLVTSIAVMALVVPDLWEMAVSGDLSTSLGEHASGAATVGLIVFVATLLIRWAHPRRQAFGRD